MRNEFTHLSIVLIFGEIIVYILKCLINRERPYETYPNSLHPVFSKEDPSFPSSHACISFLSLQFIPPNFPKALRYTLMIYLFIVALSPIMVIIHYPTDSIAGALIGLIIPRIITKKVSSTFAQNFFRALTPLKTWYTKVSSRKMKSKSPKEKPKRSP